MRLDENGSHTGVFCCAREFQIVKASAIDVRSTVNMQVHCPLQIIRQPAHALTLSVDSVSLVAIHPAIADRTAANATVPIGIEKLPVCRVILPTPHIAKAPASEPHPLSRPMAVEM